MKKAMVFFDANNFYHCVKCVVSPSRLDILKISRLLCKIKSFDLVNVYWYASVPDIKDGKDVYHKHNDFLLELESRGVKVIRRKLQRIPVREMNKKRDFIFSKIDFCGACRNLFSGSLRLFFSDKKEKGIDVWCAIDMVDKFLSEEFEVCILVSGDADFSPALNLIEKRGGRVIVASPHSGFAKELRDGFEYFVLKEEFLVKCFRGGE